MKQLYLRDPDGFGLGNGRRTVEWRKTSASCPRCWSDHCPLGNNPHGRANSFKGLSVQGFIPIHFPKFLTLSYFGITTTSSFGSASSVALSIPKWAITSSGGV